jgi:quinol monooxygenase YgiN
MPYVIVARWRPRDGERDKIEAIVRELVNEVRKEPGNLAFRDHQQTPHFKRLVLERAVPLLARRERQAFTIVE